MGYSAVHWNVKSLPLANYSSQSGNISFIVLVKYKFYCSFIHKLASNAVLAFRIRIRWIRKILVSWILAHKNMWFHGYGSKGLNIRIRIHVKIKLIQIW